MMVTMKYVNLSKPVEQIKIESLKKSREFDAQGMLRKFSKDLKITDY